MLQALLPVLTTIGSQVAKNLFPDPAEESKRAEAEKQFALAVMQQAQTLEKAAADIVKAEAQSSNWLTASWRPITMLVFVALIVARWLGYSAPNISEAETLHLWDIVQLGLGGYVIGRTAEKLMPSIAAAVRKQ
jgi:hypothetical protein